MAFVALSDVAARLTAQTQTPAVLDDDPAPRPQRYFEVADGGYVAAATTPTNDGRQTAVQRFKVRIVAPLGGRAATAAATFETLRAAAHSALLGWSPAASIRAIAAAHGGGGDRDENRIAGEMNFNCLIVLP